MRLTLALIGFVKCYKGKLRQVSSRGQGSGTQRMKSLRERAEVGKIRTMPLQVFSILLVHSGEVDHAICEERTESFLRSQAKCCYPKCHQKNILVSPQCRCGTVPTGAVSLPSTDGGAQPSRPGLYVRVRLRNKCCALLEARCFPQLLSAFALHRAAKHAIRTV